MINKESFNRIRLGIFVMTGLFLLILGLYFIGNKKNMFGTNLKLSATFNNVSGLQIGNNVRFSGIDVGTVENIEILNDTSIRVLMSIDINLIHFIRKNSIAEIGTDGLMGNKLVNIIPGTQRSPLVNQGDEIPVTKSLDTEDMLRTLDYTNRNVAIISSDLREITGNINRSKGTLYTVLMDTSLAGSLHQTLLNIEKISLNLNNFSMSLSTTVNGVKEGKGAIGELLSDSSKMSTDFRQSIRNLEEASHKISDVSADLDSVVRKMKTGSGPVATMLNDTTFSSHLKSSMANIDSSAYNFNENMKALQENFLFRKYFQRQKDNKK